MEGINFKNMPMSSISLSSKSGDKDRKNKSGMGFNTFSFSLYIKCQMSSTARVLRRRIYLLVPIQMFSYPNG